MKVKTLRRTDRDGMLRYIRASDSTARDRAAIQEKVKDGWAFCPKGEWKKLNRKRVVDEEVSDE